jgi:hypothetical protein
MTILGDGTIIPSFLGVQERGHSSSSHILSDIGLHMGEVKKIIWPDDQQSYGGQTVEYEIEVQHRQGNGTNNTAVFRGVSMSTLFGGVADRFFATMRPDNTPNNSDQIVGAGSKVLLMCINGDQQKAIILGAVEDTRVQRVEQSQDGHHLFFEFNGIQVTIDKSGQLKLLHRGATKIDGTQEDSNASDTEGTSISITQDGNITIATKDSAQFIAINHADKKIQIQADQDYTVESNQDIHAHSQGTTTLRSDDTFEIDSNQKVLVRSTGMEVGAANESFMLGTTYRSAEQTLHNQLISALSGIAASLAGVAAGLTAGASMVPPLGAAGTALTAAIPLLQQASSAITSFEAQASFYLSTKNKGD